MKGNQVSDMAVRPGHVTDGRRNSGSRTHEVYVYADVCFLLVSPTTRLDCQ